MNFDHVVAVREGNTVYRDESKCYKVFDEGTSKAVVLNEALNLARIEETGLNSPRLLEVTILEGKWAIVYEYVQGKTLARLMEENPEKKAEYLERLVELQLEVHSRSCPGLEPLRDRLIQAISVSELEATTRFELLTRLESMSKHTKLCHGNFNPTNIIISKDGSAHIIDWLRVAQGNASADAAKTFLTFWLEQDYITADKYLELFCEKSGTEKEYVRRWIAIVAAAESVTKNQARHEKLIHWFDIVDYE